MCGMCGGLCLETGLVMCGGVMAAPGRGACGTRAGVRQSRFAVHGIMRGTWRGTRRLGCLHDRGAGCQLEGSRDCGECQGWEGEGGCQDEGTVLAAVAGRRWKAGLHQLCLQLLFAPAQPSSVAHPWAACLGKEACAAAEGSACVRVDGGENHELCCTWLQTRGSEITRCEVALHQELRNRRSVAPVWRLNEVDSDGFCARGVLRLDTDGALPPPLS